MRRVLFAIGAAVIAASALLSTTANAQEAKPQHAAPATGTCAGHYPSYFQDPAFAASGMWDGQVTINQPSRQWRGPVFRLSDAFDRVPAESNFPWLRFNPFDPKLSDEERLDQTRKYMWAVMNYIQEGNVGSGDVSTDWTLCNNKVRSWYHIPYQTYDPLSGREFVHGLTREAPVTIELNGGSQYLKTTMWAVGFYNPPAARTIGKVWTGASAPTVPSGNMKFEDGAVIGKLLFTTANGTQFPFLRNMPLWQANISAPEFCTCKPSGRANACTLPEQTEQCPRTVGMVTLMQFDIAVRDLRAPIGWAYGTFVADGRRKDGERNPWNRISPLGLMWGNDTPPVGTLASQYPVDMRKNPSKQNVIFWDVVDELNLRTNAGHLGCSGRLNGPADNAQSSCLSCHQTASVPDKSGNTPPIMFQFGSLSPGNGQCMPPKPNNQMDLLVDQTYFKTFSAGMSFTGPNTVVAPPQYASGAQEWISTDFSLQLSISLAQWQEWNEHRKAAAAPAAARQVRGVLPSR